MTRRRALVAGVAAMSVVLAGCSASSNSDPNTITLSTFPFGVEKFKTAVIEPFTKATGIKVNIDTGANADRLSKLKLAHGDPGVDVVLMSDYYAALGQKDNLFQQVDVKAIPHLTEVADFAKASVYLGPAYSYQVNGTVYNTTKLNAEQASKWDLYGDKSLSGKIALPDISVTAGQLMISGIAKNYGNGPYDIDTALKKLGQWAPGVLQFYSASTEVTNLLTQGEIVAADSINAFATDLIASGKPIAWTPPATGRYMATNRAMIPTGAGNVAGANKFIDYLLSREAQSSSAEILGDLPVNISAKLPTSITAVVGDVAKDPIAAGYSTLDPNELVPTRKDWVDRFAREVTTR
jgi:putative spermidine/putrescine transport system substrate-binding protein